MDVRTRHENTVRISLISSPVKWEGLFGWSDKSHREGMHDMLFSAHTAVAKRVHCRACRFRAVQRRCSGCRVTPILTKDLQGVYRSDNHAWL